MLNFHEWLHQESIYDVPTNFYCSCHFKLEQLMNGRLIGLDGISADPEIIRKFGNPVGLKMPAKELLASNEISMMDYGDQDRMMANNMADLNRSAGMRVERFLEKMFLKLKINDVFGTPKETEIKSFFATSKFDTVAQFASMFQSCFKRIKLTKVVKAVKEIISGATEYLQQEKEWRIKGGGCYLPKTTELGIMLFEMNKQEQQAFSHSGLCAKYRVCIFETIDDYFDNAKFNEFIEGNYKHCEVA